MIPGIAFTIRFIFLTIPKRWECAKSVSEANSDLYMRYVFVARGVGARAAVGDAPTSACLLHVMADGREYGCGM